MTVDIGALQDFASTVTVTGALIIALLGGSRQWWVFGWAYREMRKDRDQWKAQALRSVQIVETVAISEGDQREA